jgi:lipoprotein-anchoring transpeptidase ErfK/SrfK
MAIKQLDDSNPYTTGWTRPKMMKALQETIPYLADDELQLIASQISDAQETRKAVQAELPKPVFQPIPRQAGWTPPGSCRNTDKEENHKMREKIALYTQGEQTHTIIK